MVTPKISVIVPVYNAENYLHCCVDSILAQTYAEFEVILVDDGSPDHCGEICDMYAQRDCRVRVIHQLNQGQAAARNHALEYAKGKWVCFVDSDDMIHPQMLELLYEAVVRNNSDMSMCGSAEGETVPETFSKKYCGQYDTVYVDESALVEMYDSKRYPYWVVWAKLIRKEIVQKHLFTVGRVYEDNAVVCQWGYDSKTMVTIPFPLYFYRINPTGTTKSNFSIKKLDYLWALEEIINFYISVNYTEMRKRFCKLYIETAALYYEVMCIQGNADKAGEIRSNIRSVFRNNKGLVKLSKDSRVKVCNSLFPRIMRIYWLISAISKTITDDGLNTLLCKIRGFLWKDEKK